MEENSCSLSVQDVASLLNTKYAVITGGKTADGYPVITFPDINVDFSALSDDDFRKLMLYLTSVPSMQDADKGFVLVIDRRNDRWSSVKTVLLKISGYFPALVQTAYVLRPSGLLQKAISGVSNKFFKEEFKFKVVLCSGLDDLHSNVDVSQLTGELGGTIAYDHEEWIHQRMAVERFSSNTKEISVGLQEMIHHWQVGELPNDVPSTLLMIEEQSKDYHVLKDDLLNAIRHGETLLSCIRRPSVESASLSLCPDKLVNVAAVERLLVQLDETEKRFDCCWMEQVKKLQQCLELREFEQEFREFQSILSQHIIKLSEMPTSGDSLVQVESILNDTENFRHNIEDDVQKAEDICRKGNKLIEGDHYARDSISPKCVELDKMVGDFKQQLHQRLEILRKYCDLHEKIEKASHWCAQGVELLAAHQVEKCTSFEFAAAAVKEVSAYLQKGAELQIDDPEQYHCIFKDSINPETRALVQQVLKRIEDMKTVCEKRHASLQKLAVKPTRPVQAVVPEPKVPFHVPLRRRSPDKERKLHKKGTKALIEVCFEENEHSDDPAYFLPIQNAGSQPSSQRNSMDLLQFKQGHVMTELIETEKMYVSELNSILQGYLHELENPAMKDLVPPSLFGKSDVLFGNLQDIYSFHSQIFLKDLENCIYTPCKVGRCFVERKDAFHRLYSLYCLNKPKSECLRLQCGDDNPFFKECQKNLNHKLPLGAYLLKPVQRITKYQLLLQDLIRYCEEEEVGDLKEALETMLAVLKYVNDSMHQVAITGFHGCLTDYGPLLLQSSFNIWVEKKKKDRIRELRFKPHQRYIFFYENLLLFTKKYGREESPSYAYKNALKTSVIGLTEKVHGSKSDSRKFEIWLHGRALVYILQAPTYEIKDKWVKEIKKVLLQQFEHLKDENKKQYSDKIMSLNGLIGESPNPQRARVASSQSWDNAPVMNNNISDNIDDEDDEQESRLRRSTLPSEGNTRESFDNQDDGWTSDDLSQTEDEEEDGDIFLNTPEGKGRYVVLGDYAAVDVGEASLHEGQIVDVEKIGCAGWWFIRSQDGTHGWVPASYLGPLSSTKRSSRSSPSVSSQDSGSGSLQHAASKSSVASNMSCTSQDGANV